MLFLARILGGLKTAAKAVGKSYVSGVKNRWNYAKNNRNMGSIPAQFMTGMVEGALSSGQPNYNVSQNDLGMWELSSILDREYQKFKRFDTYDFSLEQPLYNVPPIIGNNVPQVIDVLERNIVTVDSKVRSLGRKINSNEMLLNYSKTALDRIQKSIEDMKNESIRNRYKNIENSMEAQNSTHIDNKIRNEIAAQLAGMNQQQDGGFDFGKLIMQLMAGVGGGLVAGAALNGAGNPENMNALAEAMGLTKGLPQNDKNYSSLIDRVEKSATNGKSQINQYDLYSLTTRTMFMLSDEMRLTSKRSTTIDSMGPITIKSSQRIILSAPVIEMIGMVSSRAGIESNIGAGSRPNSSGGSSDSSGLPSGVTNNGGSSGTPGKSGEIQTEEGADRASEAYRYFKSQGWSDEAAAGIVGNLMQESGPGIDPYAVGDGGDAFGAAQWNRAGSPDRYARFEKIYGKDLTEATWKEQLEFMQWELTSKEHGNTEWTTGEKLAETKSAAEAALVFSSGYERPNAAYANNGQRAENAEGILSRKDEFAQHEKDHPIFKEDEKQTFQGDAPEGYITGKAEVAMTNKGATRNDPITDNLNAKLQEAVYTTYGPGYKAEVYSGGQEAEGEGGSRTGSTRHDHGSAADTYVIGPDGKRVTGDDLAPLIQYWLAKEYGGVGVEMNGGGIHLDEHTDRAKHWNYLKQGGRYTEGQQEAVKAGLEGKLPNNLHYVEDPEYKKPDILDITVNGGNNTDKVSSLSSDGMLQLKKDTSTANTLVAAATVEEPKVETPKPKLPPGPPLNPKKVASKNTHDGINMSAVDLVQYAHGIS